MTATLLFILFVGASIWFCEAMFIKLDKSRAGEAERSYSFLIYGILYFLLLIVVVPQIQKNLTSFKVVLFASIGCVFLKWLWDKRKTLGERIGGLFIGFMLVPTYVIFALIGNHSQIHSFADIFNILLFSDGDVPMEKGNVLGVEVCLLVLVALIHKRRDFLGEEEDYGIKDKWRSGARLLSQEEVKRYHN